MCSFTCVLLHFQRFVALCASGPAHRKAAPARGKLPLYEATTSNNIRFVALCVSSFPPSWGPPSGLLEANEQASKAKQASKCISHSSTGFATERFGGRPASPEPRASTAQSGGPCPVDSSASRQAIDNISRLGGMRGAFE